MRAIDLDYLNASRSRHWSAWALLVLGALAVMLVNREAEQTERRVDDLVAKRTEARRSGGGTPMAPVAPKETLTAEIRSAHAIFQRLSTPWSALFDSIEAAQSSGVRLSGLEPDGGARSAVLSGEARDYLAVLNYVNALESKGRLERVHLIRHESKAKAAGYPLTFSVQVAWGAHSGTRTEAQPAGLSVEP